MANKTSSLQKKLIQERFTTTAGVFADYAVTYRAQFAERLAEMLRATSNDRAADLACGPGTLALPFARRVRWVCGIDLTIAMLERARLTAESEGLGNIFFAIGDALSLPFEDESLDIVVTSYSLHHMSDPALVIREMARVAKPGGRVGIIDIVVPDDARRAQVANRIEIARDPSHTRSLPRSELEAMLAGANLRLVGAELGEMPRMFDHWMHVAGAHRGDAAYQSTRRLMIESMPDDFAGFHPRFALGEESQVPLEEQDIAIVNSGIFLAAEKVRA